VPNTLYVLITRHDGTPAERVHVTLTDITNKNPDNALPGDKADADDTAPPRSRSYHPHR